jgi:hypothetical protein
MSILFRRRECLVPTWRGWLAILLVAALVGTAFTRGIYSWLAVQDPVPGGVLVVEGWAPDHALKAALAEFRARPYEGLYTTGIPLEQGAVLSQYKTYANLSASVIVGMGADPQEVHAVPTSEIKKDRTYATAIALRDWLAAHHVSAEKVNVFTIGAHARRTRLLYEMAFGPGSRIGIVAVPHNDFNPGYWWRSSSGFRTITSEVIAYGYARFLFHPEPVPVRE